MQLFVALRQCSIHCQCRRSRNLQASHYLFTAKIILKKLFCSDQSDNLLKLNRKKLVFRVKYRQNHCNQFVRKQQFDEVDFLSFVGGLLNLFTGFSFISFVEIFYWFIYRAITRLCISEKSNRVQPFNSNYDKSKKFLSEYFQESSIHSFVYWTKSTIFDK